jgi:hypothetical protein
MKVKILAGLVTALIYGGTAMAQDDTQSNTQGNTQEQQSPDNIGGSGLEQSNPNPDDLIILDQQDVAPVPDTSVQDQGVGGSGDQGLPGDVNNQGDVNDQDAIGGSGKPSTAPQGVQPQGVQSGIPMQGQGGVTLYCTPVNQPSTGGSGLPQGNEQSSLTPTPMPSSDVGSADIHQDQALGGAGYEVAPVAVQPKNDLRGVSVLLGGGVEGYTGGLAPEINPGATAGVMAALRPSNVFGLELGYNGAVNNLDTDVAGSGPDLVRNSIQADVTLGLTATPIQPYVLGGYGLNWYNVRNGEAIGFRDDTNSKIPVGLGLRTQLGDFTADARVNYNFLLSDDFAPAIDNGDAATGSYNGTINIGGTF